MYNTHCIIHLYTQIMSSAKYIQIICQRNRDSNMYATMEVPSANNVQATLNDYFANWTILYFTANLKKKLHKPR